MDTSNHNMSNLFAQLGLPNSEQEINEFIAIHRDLNESMLLDQAPFWSKAQASFLKGALSDDSDWAEVVDHLNVSLHH